MPSVIRWRKLALDGAALARVMIAATAVALDKRQALFLRFAERAEGARLASPGKAPLKQGQKVPVTLEFEKAGKVDVTLDVQAVEAQSPAAARPGHKM
jgi:hypothetical protein